MQREKQTNKQTARYTVLWKFLHCQITPFFALGSATGLQMVVEKRVYGSIANLRVMVVVVWDWGISFKIKRSDGSLVRSFLTMRE